jgi:transposase
VVMLAEQYEYVIGGDPDRDSIDLAVVDTATGAVRGRCSDRTDAHGYTRLLGWAARQAPGRRVWALEGTGSFAAGLATVLAEAGEDVVEVSGGKRTRGAKSDRIDAVRAARTALAREQQAEPRARGASGGAAADSRYPAGRSGQPHESHQRAEEPHRGRSGTPARPLCAACR